MRRYELKEKYLDIDLWVFALKYSIEIVGN